MFMGGRVAVPACTVNPPSALHSQFYAQKWPETTPPANIVSNETGFSG